MSAVGQREIKTQKRIVRLLEQQLGYRYLGDWHYREGNANIEADLLRGWLLGRGVDEVLSNRALYQLEQAAALGAGKNLYDANKAVYGLLRYGVKVKAAAGEQFQTVWLIDWRHPHENDFAIAEEVTVKGANKKRPDIVLYVNGIALGVIELKRSTVSVSEGIRQNLDNQQKAFIRNFYSTMQLVMAGNDTEGLRYGTIDTPEKYYLTWKEENTAYNPGTDERSAKYLPTSHCDSADNPLDCALLRLCNKTRFLELLHDFIVFDMGIKKVPRHNQYFGVKAAQRRVSQRQAGIIWHTQGSGKSLTMVWLAKWIRENVRDARVLIITDRTELDEQIEGVFTGVDEQIYRTTSGADLIVTLNAANPWLVCSLVHKFGRDSAAAENAAIDAYVREIAENLPSDFSPKGNLYVFVDECHRTQSGKLHAAMKAIVPGAMFIGFTGTPLLKKDKQKSVEVFGTYIHTYKFDEAVRDGVVLDLRYEARDIDQHLASPAKVDQWFAAKTKGLSDLARAQLKQTWGTLQKVQSNRSRIGQIVADILLDMETRPRLADQRGNAMLVCQSIYQACRTYELFSQTDLKGKCAIVTSYRPHIANVKGQESGEGVTEQLLQYNVYRRMVADYFDVSEDEAGNMVETFEHKIKERFVKEPGQMRLLIVVDKLLTGFDAPPATYLYIDKPMRDHGLFQAICRVNRLDGDDKEYGYIVDYRDLFQSLEGAVSDYTSSALDGYDAEDVAGLLTDRLAKARERLEETRETIKALCESVALPRDTPDYLHYFCAADTADMSALKDNEPRRVGLYKATAALMRAYANLANEMTEAGYSPAEAAAIKQEVTHFEAVRQSIMLASGDYIDTKLYEPAMRHLIDQYIRADDSEVVSQFDNLGLVELIVERGLAALDALPAAIKQNETAVAETIENNIRRIIVDEQPTNPKYYEEMSELLDALIAQRRAAAFAYREYMEQMKQLADRVLPGSLSGPTGSYPRKIDTPAKRALYDNVGSNAQLALAIDHAIRTTKKDNWVGNRLKEREVVNAIREQLEAYDVPTVDVAVVIELAKNQNEYK